MRKQLKNHHVYVLNLKNINEYTLVTFYDRYEKKNKLEEALKNAREEFEKLYQANKKIEDGTLKKNK